MTFWDRILVGSKFLVSFLKREWTLDDYPIRMRHQEPPSTIGSPRWRPVRWTARILNWPIMQGYGDTREEALANLRDSLDSQRASGHKLPRPGVHQSVRLASATVVSQHADLARDFLRRILDFNPDHCFISDESRLWDFHGEETNEALNDKIARTYGVDVSDIESGNLAQILERLSSLGIHPQGS
jgi:hypothetical protein